MHLILEISVIITVRCYTRYGILQTLVFSLGRKRKDLLSANRNETASSKSNLVLI